MFLFINILSGCAPTTAVVKELENPQLKYTDTGNSLIVDTATETDDTNEDEADSEGGSGNEDGSGNGDGSGN